MTEAELQQIECRMAEYGSGEISNGEIAGLIAEVRRLRGAIDKASQEPRYEFAWESLLRNLQ